MSQQLPFRLMLRSRRMRAAESPPRIAAVLRPLVRMNQRAAWPSTTDSYQHGIEHERAVNRGAHGPADDLAREQVHADSQVEPPLPRPDVRDVGHPRFVGARDRELARQQIGNQDRGLTDAPPNRCMMDTPLLCWREGGAACRIRELRIRPPSRGCLRRTAVFERREYAPLVIRLVDFAACPKNVQQPRRRISDICRAPLGTSSA